MKKLLKDVTKTAVTKNTFLFFNKSAKLVSTSKLIERHTNITKKFNHEQIE